MANHLEIEYPKALTAASWNKAKSVLAKKHKTGLGEAIDKLEAAHKKVTWASFKFDYEMGIKFQTDRLSEWPDVYTKQIKPLIALATTVETTATKAAAIYKNDKLIPSATQVAAVEVAKQALIYGKTLELAKKKYEDEVTKVNIKYLDNIRRQLKPRVEVILPKIDGLIQLIKSYASNPTKENFFNSFSNDGYARAFTTALKNMDQDLGKFPDIRNQIWPANYSLVKNLLPGMADYGAEWSKEEFEKKVNARLSLDGNTEDCWKVHARLLLKQVTNVQKFAQDCQKLLKIL